MPIQRLSHVVLWVSNASRTAAFYEEILDFRVVASTRGGRSIFMQAPDSSNDHDLGLFEIGDGAGPSTAGRETVGMYHIAWEVDSLLELGRIGQALAERGALVGATNHGTTKSLYAQDPDGLEFEVQWLLPADSITAEDRAIIQGLPLDLASEIERFGATTRGGVGVSH
jgi:catechol-2,3-dioxygenase